MLIEYKAKKEIGDKDMADLVCTALEGGSDYWIDRIVPVYPAGHTAESYKPGGKFEDNHSYGIPFYNVWLYEGGSLKIKTQDEVNGKNVFVFDKKSIEKAFQLMAEAKIVDGRFWNDFINENYDAETADVFLQLALFGELVFG